MVEGELEGEDGVILRIKLIVAFGWASTRVKRPVAVATEGGKGTDG